MNVSCFNFCSLSHRNSNLFFNSSWSPCSTGGWDDADNNNQQRRNRDRERNLDNGEQGQQGQQQEKNADDENIDIVWYSDGLVPPSRANIAFSLYGKLKSTNNDNFLVSMIGGSAMKCNSRNYINSFYTTAGFDVFLQSLASAGIAVIQDSTSNDDGSSTSLSSTCTLVNDANGNQVGETVACWGDQFAKFQFSITTYATYSTCHGPNRGVEIDALDDFNNNLTENGNCAILYTNSSFDSVSSLLQNSASCTIRDSIGKHTCPDPYRKLKKYATERKTQSVYRRISPYGRRMIDAYTFIIFACVAFVCTIYVYWTYHHDSKSNFLANNIPFSIDYVDTCTGKVNDDDVSTLGVGDSVTGPKHTGTNETRALPTGSDGQQLAAESDGQQLAAGSDGQQLAAGSDGQQLATGSDGYQVAASPVKTRVNRIQHLVKRLKDNRNVKDGLLCPSGTTSLLSDQKNEAAALTATRNCTDTTLNLNCAEAFGSSDHTTFHGNNLKRKNESAKVISGFESKDTKMLEKRDVVDIPEDVLATQTSEAKREHCEDHDNVDDDNNKITSESSSTSLSDVDVDDILFGRQISCAPSFRTDCDETKVSALTQSKQLTFSTNKPRVNSQTEKKTISRSIQNVPPSNDALGTEIGVDDAFDTVSVITSDSNINVPNTALVQKVPRTISPQNREKQNERRNSRIKTKDDLKQDSKTLNDKKTTNMRAKTSTSPEKNRTMILLNKPEATANNSEAGKLDDVSAKKAVSGKLDDATAKKAVSGKLIDATVKKAVSGKLGINVPKEDETVKKIEETTKDSEKIKPSPNAEDKQEDEHVKKVATTEDAKLQPPPTTARQQNRQTSPPQKRTRTLVDLWKRKTNNKK